ncbi:DUF3572 domain-containing protein [Neorhizobium alkalisoli]|uniref:Uncharacterized protein DUF3572 n=1 Tax=Neorhizobium alkalisoli TaxID=528178 RepID=A0A561R1W8_9HYPH|nr:DUF3572 domain-containing protein [Neorhizobium alkalisoli]TWF56617.1 uncharacterized protein DUF3572 [Neorhizobium alkalisoli]
MQRDGRIGKVDAGQAEQTAAAILGWLAGEPDMLGRFLALSGLQADQLRHAVNDSGFLAGMVDFLMSHEPTLMAFCEATGTKPETVAAVSLYYTRPGLDSGQY